MELLRGRVYLANLTDQDDAEPKPWIVVSRNGRNRGLGNALAVRVTTTNKYTELASVVQLPDGECIHGWVRCDDLTKMWDDEPVRELGALSAHALRTVERGLRGALDL